MTKITWITHACFKIKSDSGKIIYIDPYKMGDDEPADIILASHDHYDHADKKSIKNVITNKSVLICPKTCTSGLSKFNAMGMGPGDSKEINGIKIQSIRSYTPNKNFHPKKNDWLGYIIEVDGKRIYHAGDTDIIPEMNEISNIDVALLPVGDTYTMGFEDAAEACAIINPKICVPMHDWDKDLNEFERLVKEKAPNVKVEILKGKDLEI
ncbi:MAG: MBL fold metallo-hydrolase [Candidatus Lokiarchaeota archaeon]|nr:MBL fold metallo-hydrolase [Candidatus Lokiarchaeota archaeon]